MFNGIDMENLTKRKLSICCFTLILHVFLLGCTYQLKQPQAAHEPAQQEAADHLLDFESPLFARSDRFKPWRLDQNTAQPVDDFSNHGNFFKHIGVESVNGYRLDIPFQNNPWITASIYTRSMPKGADILPIQHFLKRVTDPEDQTNQVLRLKSPAHSDGVILRSTHPLPKDYKISLKIGYADYGDGRSKRNGYSTGNESALPWHPHKASEQNGFYWLSILDTQPQPQNNTWIHHHRKFVIDSDNHAQGWMQMATSNQEFVVSGEQPIMVFAVAGQGQNHERIGMPFLSYAQNQVLKPGIIRAIDAYKANQWYQVSIQRLNDVFRFEITGDFKYAHQAKYRGSIDTQEHCVWHSNRPSEPIPSVCQLDEKMQYMWSEMNWLAGDEGKPDYFMIGDPHVNYYEGQVLIDDIRFEKL